MSRKLAVISSLLVVLVGVSFNTSDAEAGRCCRNRTRRCCNVGWSGGGNVNQFAMNTCAPQQCAVQGCAIGPNAGWSGQPGHGTGSATGGATAAPAPAPEPAAAPAPPPAPAAPEPAPETGT